MPRRAATFPPRIAITPENRFRRIPSETVHMSEKSPNRRMATSRKRKRCEPPQCGGPPVGLLELGLLMPSQQGSCCNTARAGSSSWFRCVSSATTASSTLRLNFAPWLLICNHVRSSGGFPLLPVLRLSPFPAEFACLRAAWASLCRYSFGHETPPSYFISPFLLRMSLISQ
jgi:hypothetical protein